MSSWDEFPYKERPKWGWAKKIIWSGFSSTVSRLGRIKTYQIPYIYLGPITFIHRLCWRCHRISQFYPLTSWFDSLNPYMVVSINGGTPKSSILDWDFPLWNITKHLFWDRPLYGNPHLLTHLCHPWGYPNRWMFFLWENPIYKWMMTRGIPPWLWKSPYETLTSTLTSI